MPKHVYTITLKNNAQQSKSEYYFDWSTLPESAYYITARMSGARVALDFYDYHVGMVYTTNLFNNTNELNISNSSQYNGTSFLTSSETPIYPGRQHCHITNNGDLKIMILSRPTNNIFNVTYDVNPARTYLTLFFESID